MDTYSYAEVKKRIGRFRTREADWLASPKAGSDAGLRDLFYSDCAADMALFCTQQVPGKRIRRQNREQLVQARRELRQGERCADTLCAGMLAELMREMIRLRQKRCGGNVPPVLEAGVSLRSLLKGMLAGKNPFILTGRIALTDLSGLSAASGDYLVREARLLCETVPSFRSDMAGLMLDRCPGISPRRFGRFRICRTKTRRGGDALAFLYQGERFALLSAGEEPFRDFAERLARAGFEMMADPKTPERVDFLCLTLSPGGGRQISTSREYLRTVSRELDRIARGCWGKNVPCLIARMNRKGQRLLEEASPFFIRRDYREVERMLSGKAYRFLLRLHPRKSKSWIEQQYYAREQAPGPGCLTDPKGGSRLMHFQKLCPSRMGAVCRESDTCGSMAGPDGPSRQKSEKFIKD